MDFVAPTWEEFYADAEDIVTRQCDNTDAAFEVLSLLGCFLRVHLCVQRTDPVTDAHLQYVERELTNWWRELRFSYLRSQGEQGNVFIQRERAVEAITDHIRSLCLDVQLSTS